MQQLGRYTLHGLLGEGGSAKVYEAELNGPAGFRKRVALKIVANELDDEQRNDLINEARLGALLRHPNVVDIYELVEIDNQLFVAMELVEGPTFLELIRRHGPPPADVALDLCRQITRGLVHAHGLKVDGRPANLIHRDLKLSNILLDPAGLAKISDFGIARAETISSSQTAAGLVRGSLGYMSPEQMTGSPLDQRTDLFSLGVVFYQLLTGSRLIKAATPREYFTRLLDIDKWIHEPKIIDPVRGLIPGMEDLLFQMLRKNYEQRLDAAIWVRKDLNTLRAAQGSKVGMQPWLEQIFGMHPLPGTQPFIRGDWSLEQGTQPNSGEEEPLMEALSTGIMESKPAPAVHFPFPTDDFIGRSVLVESLMEYLRGEGRLICLKGHGGVGKTRLASELVSKLWSNFMGGSWFCSLEDVTRREDMLSRMIEGLKLSTPVRNAKAMDEAIATVLAIRGPSLIILDAAEGIPSQVQKAVQHWMTIAPDVRWLITSRRLIKIPDARIVEVGPMSIADALELYRNRSDSMLPGFSDQISSKKLRRLVAAAERIPYAIELIASQAAEKSPEDMIDELEKKSSSSKDRFIEATVGWSWRQLSPWERWTLAQLSVFRGGFFIEQAEEVVDLSPWPEAPWVVHVVGGLLEKSLLTTKATEVGPRFDLYRMVSKVAEAVLTGQRGTLRDSILHDSCIWERDESQVLKKLEMDRDRVYARHAQLFGRLGHETYQESLYRHGGLKLWKRHKFERQNLEVSFERSLKAGRSQDACNLLIGLGVLWAETRSEREALSWVDRVLNEAELSKSARARILFRRANFLRRLGRLDRASEQAREVIDRAREIRSSSLFNQAKITLSGIYRDQGDIASAQKLAQSVLQVALQHHKDTLEVRARNHLALCYEKLGKSQEAVREYEQGLSRAVEIGDVFHQAMMQGNLALSYGRVGRLEEARRFFQAAISAECALSQNGRAAVAMANLGHLEIAQGNYDAAESALQEAYDVHLISGRIGNLCQDLLGLGVICMYTGRIDKAEEHLELACTMARQRRSFVDLAIFSIFAGQRCLLAGELRQAEDRIEDALRYSRRLGWSQGEAVSMSLLGGIAIEGQDYVRAEQCLAKATKLLDERHLEDHAQIHVYKARLALYCGDPSSARQHLASGHELRNRRSMGENSPIGLELEQLAIEISEGSCEETAILFGESGDVTNKLI